MKEKITNYLLYFFGVALMAAGCVGLWGRHPLIAVGVMLTGVSLLPILYIRLHLRARLWRYVIPILGLLFVCACLLSVPKKDISLSEYMDKEIPTFVYISNSGEHYHYEQSCAGKNPRRTKFEYIKGQEITPCERCCDL